MSDPAKTRPARKPSQAVAPRGPDLEAMGALLTETASQMRPMVSHASSRRARLQTDLKQCEAEVKMLDDEWALIEAYYQSVKAGYADERADLDDEIRMMRNALLDGAEAQEGAAA